MITISQAVEEAVKNKKFLEEALGRELVNLSALSREIKPEVEKAVMKKVKEGAIVMALKRLSQRQKKTALNPQVILDMRNITVRSDLVEFTFATSPTIAHSQEEFLKSMAGVKNSFCNLSQGIFEMTLIVKKDASMLVEKFFKKERLISKFENLSSLSIALPEETVSAPGVYYSVLKTLAWEGINVVEVFSTYTELTIVFDERDIDRAFSVIKSRLGS
jgi:aspartokinase